MDDVLDDINNYIKNRDKKVLIVFDKNECKYRRENKKPNFYIC